MVTHVVNAVMISVHLNLQIFYCSLGESTTGDTGSGNLYQKLAPLHVTKIVRCDWSAVFESEEKCNL